MKEYLVLGMLTCLVILGFCAVFYTPQFFPRSVGVTESQFIEKVGKDYTYIYK